MTKSASRGKNALIIQLRLLMRSCPKVPEQSAPPTVGCLRKTEESSTMIISFSLHNSCSNKMCQVIFTKPFCDIYSNYVSVCYGYEQSFSCGSASFNEYRLLLFEPNGRCFYNRSVKCIACIYHLCFQQKQIYDDLHTVYVLLFLQHSYKQTFKRVFRQCRKDRQLIFIQRDIPSHRKRYDCVCDLSRSRIDDTCGDNWRQFLAKEV